MTDKKSKQQKTKELLKRKDSNLTKEEKKAQEESKEAFGDDRTWLDD